MAITWDAGFPLLPAESDDPKQGFRNIAETRQAVGERLEHEHEMAIATPTAAVQGWHKLGSAKIYVGTAEPTMRADGVTALDSDDTGRLFYNSDDSSLWIWVTDAWVALNAGGSVEAHNAVTDAHSATALATASRIMLRDAAGRCKVVAPAAETDIALQSTVTAHNANQTTAHGAASSATASRIVVRDTAGRARFATPSNYQDAANKDYVDTVSMINSFTTTNPPIGTLIIVDTNGAFDLNESVTGIVVATVDGRVAYNRGAGTAVSGTWKCVGSFYVFATGYAVLAVRIA